MRSRFSLFSSLLTLGVVIGTSHAVSVEFRQLDWLGDDCTVKYPFSRVGEVELHFDPIADQMFIGQFAFVNIVTRLAQPTAQPQWSVQNWPLIYPNLEHLLGSSPSVQFDLGNQSGQPVNQMFFNVIITPKPLQEVPLELVQLSLVSTQPYHVGGVRADRRPDRGQRTVDHSADHRAVHRHFSILPGFSRQRGVDQRGRRRSAQDR